MKIILLAAGRGTRISREINGIPKSCIKIGNEPLIVNSVKKLKSIGFDKIAIVTGYESNFLTRTLIDYDIKFYNNPFYSVTNSVASLWFSKDFFQEDEDLYIMNADVFFDINVIEKLISSKQKFLLLADSSKIIGADYKFNWKDDKLIKFGKELSIEETTGEYIGIGKISKNAINIFKESLDNLIENGQINCWWEDVLYSLVSSNKEVVNIIDIAGKYFWGEVDFVEDYNRIIKYLENQ